MEIGNLELECLIEDDNYIDIIAKGLASDQPNVRLQIYKLLATLCNYSETGHSRVLKIFDQHKVNFELKYRFIGLVKALNDVTHVDEKEKEAILKLINSILDGSNSNECDRIILQNEFIGLELLNTLHFLKLLHAANERFVHLINETEQHVMDQGDKFFIENIDINSPIELFNVILKQVAGTPEEIAFLTVLRHLMLININHKTDEKCDQENNVPYTIRTNEPIDIAMNNKNDDKVIINSSSPFRKKEKKYPNRKSSLNAWECIERAVVTFSLACEEDETNTGEKYLERLLLKQDYQNADEQQLRRPLRSTTTLPLLSNNEYLPNNHDSGSSDEPPSCVFTRCCCLHRYRYECQGGMINGDDSATIKPNIAASFDKINTTIPTMMISSNLTTSNSYPCQISPIITTSNETFLKGPINKQQQQSPHIDDLKSLTLNQLLPLRSPPPPPPPPLPTAVYGSLNHPPKQGLLGGISNAPITTNTLGPFCDIKNTRTSNIDNNNLSISKHPQKQPINAAPNIPSNSSTDNTKSKTEMVDGYHYNNTTSKNSILKIGNGTNNKLFPNDLNNLNVSTESLPQLLTPTPKTKLKTLNWIRIPIMKILSQQNTTHENVWMASRWKRKNLAEQYHIDFTYLEELFMMSTQQQPSLTSNGGKRKSLSSLEAGTSRRLSNNGSNAFLTTTDTTNKRQQEILLLEPKRNLNVSIYLKQFKNGYEEIIANLRDGKGTKIGVEKLRGLFKILPDTYEIEMLRSYPDDFEKLGVAEKFLLRLTQLTDYQLRVEGLLLKEDFINNLDDILPALDSIIYTAQDIKNCTVLHEILLLTVYVGNFINSGGYAGNAAGIKLSSLLKISEIRGNNPKIGLIHFVAEQLNRLNIQTSKLISELKYIEKAQKISMDALVMEISSLTTKCGNLSSQVVKAEGDVKYMLEDFLRYAKQEMDSIQKDIVEINKWRLTLADFFCEDRETFKLEECFKIFYVFLERLRRADLENGIRKLEEQKRKSNYNTTNSRRTNNDFVTTKIQDNNTFIKVKEENDDHNRTDKQRVVSCDAVTATRTNKKQNMLSSKDDYVLSDYKSSESSSVFTEQDNDSLRSGSSPGSYKRRFRKCRNGATGVGGGTNCFQPSSSEDLIEFLSNSSTANTVANPEENKNLPYRSSCNKNRAARNSSNHLQQVAEDGSDKETGGINNRILFTISNASTQYSPTKINSNNNNKQQQDTISLPITIGSVKEESSRHLDNITNTRCPRKLDGDRNDEQPSDKMSRTTLGIGTHLQQHNRQLSLPEKNCHDTTGLNIISHSTSPLVVSDGDYQHNQTIGRSSYAASTVTPTPFYQQDQYYSQRDSGFIDQNGQDDVIITTTMTIDVNKDFDRNSQIKTSQGDRDIKNLSNLLKMIDLEETKKSKSKLNSTSNNNNDKIINSPPPDNSNINKKSLESLSTQKQQPSLDYYLTGKDSTNSVNTEIKYIKGQNTNSAPIKTTVTCKSSKNEISSVNKNESNNKPKGGQIVPLVQDYGTERPEGFQDFYKQILRNKEKRDFATAQKLGNNHGDVEQQQRRRHVEEIDVDRKSKPKKTIPLSTTIKAVSTLSDEQHQSNKDSFINKRNSLVNKQHTIAATADKIPTNNNRASANNSSSSRKCESHQTSQQLMKRLSNNKCKGDDDDDHSNNNPPTSRLSCQLSTTPIKSTPSSRFQLKKYEGNATTTTKSGNNGISHSGINSTANSGGGCDILLRNKCVLNSKKSLNGSQFSINSLASSSSSPISNGVNESSSHHNNNKSWQSSKTTIASHHRNTPNIVKMKTESKKTAGLIHGQKNNVMVRPYTKHISVTITYGGADRPKFNLSSSTGGNGCVSSIPNTKAITVDNITKISGSGNRIHDYPRNRLSPNFHNSTTNQTSQKITDFHSISSTLYNPVSPDINNNILPNNKKNFNKSTSRKTIGTCTTKSNFNKNPLTRSSTLCANRYSSKSDLTRNSALNLPKLPRSTVCIH